MAGAPLLSQKCPSSAALNDCQSIPGQSVHGMDHIDDFYEFNMELAALRVADGDLPTNNIILVPQDRRWQKDLVGPQDSDVTTVPLYFL